MFKTKRRKELEAKEYELFVLKQKIDEMKHWCAAESPEIGFAMLHMQKLMISPDSVSSFRQKLRLGWLTFDNYKKESDKLKDLMMESGK